MLSNWIHCTKNSFFFLKIFWKDGLSKKKSHCNMIFLLLSYFWGKEIPSSISFFPKIWSYSLVGKWKMIFLKKYMEIWYFLQMFWKNSLFKKIVLEYDLSRIIRKHDISFSRKYIFYIDGKWKMIFLKKYMEIWCFLYIRKRQYFLFLQTWNYPSVKKAKRIFSLKNTPKYDISGITEKDDTHPEKNDIGIPGWHSRPPMVLCTFMEELHLGGAWASIKENICPIGNGL